MGGVLGFGAIASSQQPAMPQKKTWVQRQVVDRLQFSGLRSLGYQSFQFDGDPEAFNSLTNFGTGAQRFTDIGNLQITGNKVLGFMDFRANFTDNRFADPEQQQYTLNYNRGGLDFSFGTVQASLNSGNRFINFSRSLEGLNVGFTKGRVSTRVIRSETRGATRTVTIEGNNTSGPFTLQSGRIIPDTLQLRLDGEVLTLGKDFTLDLMIGTVSLVNRIVPPTSALVATYESYDFAGQRGTLQGGTIGYDFGYAGKVGFTQIEQLTGNNNSNPERQERSFGFGRPGDQYFLLFEPIPTSIRITVNGVPRSFSVTDDGVSDFFLDPRLPILIISRVAIPTNQEIIFTYLPKAVQTVQGDRLVTGWEYSLPLGNKTPSLLSYSESFGRLKTAAGSGGSARAVDLRLNEGRGDFRANFRTVQPGYTAIEQTGFNRNEDATEYSYSQYSKGFTTEARTVNSSFGFIDASGATPITINTRVVSEEASVGYRDPKRKNLEGGRNQSLKWNRVKTTGVNESELKTLSFNETFRNGKWNYASTIENQSGRARISGNQSNLSLETYRFRAGYIADQFLTINGSISQSDIRQNGTPSTGMDYSIGAALAERGPWTANVDYTFSDSGALASLNGFLNGNALGFNNNGFTDSGGTGVLGTGQLKSRRFLASVTHRAGEKLVLTSSIVNQTATGLSTSNATIDTLSLNASYRVSTTDSLNFDWATTTSSFFSGSVQQAKSSTLNAFYNGTRGKLVYSGGVNIFDTSGDSFSQGASGYNLELSYNLDRRQRLFYSFNGSNTRGFLPQNDFGFNAGYGYSIGGGLLLQARYQSRDLRNLDPLATAGSFRSNGIVLELTLDFASRR